MSTDDSDPPANGTNTTQRGADVDLPSTIATLDETETYRVLLKATNWATLEHAYGFAAEAPKLLAELVAPDQSTRTKALDYLHHTLHHQNTLYEATVPAALCVAAILPNPRISRTVDKNHGSFPGCVRTELLLWIASVADAVTDEVDVLSRRHGFPLDDTDRHTAEAAITACVRLLDDARLLHHRTALIPAIRQTLGTSELWQHGERAIDALDAWGEDKDTDTPTDSASWPVDTIEGYSEPPPF
ncbi:hypothetical protein ACFWOB_34580 [Streptomyces sp. NPDC058420]|uniref:hypothetical protein n=1 Tax=Streptomyces sp. NPDC058420 TaxID=3346489 RepID=UPI0036641F7F